MAIKVSFPTLGNKIALKQQKFPKDFVNKIICGDAVTAKSGKFSFLLMQKTLMFATKVG